MFQRDSVGAVMRAIPNEIASLDGLGMPPVVSEFAHFKRGIVLVTGPTGSGKSTTLASIIDLVNSTRACHVMTVEDPIEFMHRHKKAIVNQREVGADTLSFAAALKHALRQDPDVILVGEMRDLETISTAITAAETGHLVFATLHTQDAPQSIERIIDSFPADQQQQVRVQIAGSIQAVISQQLVPTARAGRVAAVEIMVANPAIRNMIREGKVHQIHSVMQAGARYGMQTMDQALANHVKAGHITHEVALERCHNPDDFHTLAGGGR
jgi:twitching motility protein PilT